MMIHCTRLYKGMASEQLVERSKVANGLNVIWVRVALAYCPLSSRLEMSAATFSPV